MKMIEFTHTQYQTPVSVWVDHVMAVVYMPAMKSAALVAQGGAAIPVEGSYEQVKKKIADAKQGTTPTIKSKEDTSGISVSKNKVRKNRKSQ